MKKADIKKNEVAIVEPNSSLPDYLRTGMLINDDDNFDSSDVSIPMVKLLQGLSNECTQFAEAKAGNFWHTGVDMSLGSSFKFVVASRRKKYLLIAPIADGQGVLARSDDAKTWDRKGSWEVKIDKKNKATWNINSLDVAQSGLTEWGTSNPDDENSPPAATLVYEYLVLLPDYPEVGPAVVSLARSAIKKAKRGLNDKIQLHRNNGRPLQSITFMAKAVEEASDSGAYNNWSFTSAGFASEDVYKQALAVSKLLANYSVKNEEAVIDEPTADVGESSAF